MADDGVQVERAVRLVPVKEYGDADDGDMGQQQCRHEIAPGRELEKALEHWGVPEWREGACRYYGGMGLDRAGAGRFNAEASGWRGGGEVPLGVGTSPA
ncbi:hypothetical protein JCM17961_50210 [Endothiovibrio diazotrophicus]